MTLADLEKTPEQLNAERVSQLHDLLDRNWSSKGKLPERQWSILQTLIEIHGVADVHDYVLELLVDAEKMKIGTYLRKICDGESIGRWIETKMDADDYLGG